MLGIECYYESRFIMKTSDTRTSQDKGNYERKRTRGPNEEILRCDIFGSLLMAFLSFIRILLFNY